MTFWIVFQEVLINELELKLNSQLICGVTYNKTTKLNVLTSFELRPFHIRAHPPK